MNMTFGEALRRPLEENLQPFLQALRQSGLPCQVSEEAGEQILWVPEPAIREVRALYARYPQGWLTGPPAVSYGTSPSFWQDVGQSPVTLGILLLTLVCAVVTGLGDDLDTLRWFSFVDFVPRGDYLYFARLTDTLAAGEWWRLISPVFIHFGLLHLTMNGLWYWELGRRIEQRQRGALLLVLTLGFGLVSNLAQYLWSGPGLFGGLSGVLYGLLGHCWLFQRLAPCAAYRLPPGVAGMMLVWLLICLSGVISVLSSGTLVIANAAHVSGLLAGCLTGSLGGWLARRTAYPE